jgi:RNA polymerase sigma-70 factor (ECF subfamily)
MGRMTQARTAVPTDRETVLIGLMARTAAGDMVAFSQLYALTAPQLFHVASRMLRQREVAEEVLQECFVTVWMRAGSYHPERGAVFGWLATIVRNRALDILRSRKPLHVPEDAAQNVASEAPSPLDNAESSEAAQLVTESLRKLPDKMRIAIELAYYDGYDYFEIADRLQTPVNTVKSWVHRGLKRLKRDVPLEVGVRR